ncbi:dermonecrotic toxin domain-containing protein [Pseudomonas asplenii]|uniref:Dermonecrotic toxin N-terminal domain-containing protein n=1 Tax=Pseudomonas asplenii TaxID=53407 RepID=A0A1H6LGI9_9PSED|nr:DUF6543 domain-containing protein [Pseudomonas fuscovaginae]SEH87631.1 hypothetical protein SAMN05216581_0269 [Pseudomonas fuscovaginae]
MTDSAVSAPLSESDQALQVLGLGDCLAARPSLESATAHLVQAMLEDYFPAQGEALRTAAFINLTVGTTSAAPASYQIIPLTHRLIDCWLGKAAPDHPLGSYLTLYPGAEAPQMLRLQVAKAEELVSEWAPALLQTYMQSLVDFWSSPALSGQKLSDVWRSPLAQGVSPWQQLSDFIATQLRKASTALTGDELDTVHGVLDFPDFKARSQALGNDCTKARITLVRIPGNAPLYQQALVLTRQVGQRQIVLLYTLLGGIKSFDSIKVLEADLGQTLSDSDPDPENYSADDHVFDALTATLLTRQLENIRTLNAGDYCDRAALDRHLYELTGPQVLVGAFSSAHEETLRQLHDLLPDWLQQASAVDRATYGRYVSRLSEVHRFHFGEAFLASIPSIFEFAQQELAKSLLKLDPKAKDVVVDRIRVTLTQSDSSPWEMADPGFTAQDLRTQSSTRSYVEMALLNVDAFPLSATAQVHYDQQAAGEEQTPPSWMTYERLRAAVSDANVGATYPALLKQKLQRNTTERYRQHSLFTHYLQVLLPMLALELRLTQRLTECARLYVTAVMSMDTHVLVLSGLSIVVRPLALLAHPGAAADPVLNHFVIGPRMVDRGPQVLLRPGATEPLLEFASLAHLLAAIQVEGELQQSVLAGLDDYSRKIYDQGGFLEPHLTRIILSTWDLPEIPEPPTLDTTVLSGTVVEALFAASVETLIRHAEAISVSNAEARRKLLTDLGWALFSLLIPWAPGALAGVGLIVQLLPSLKALTDPNTQRPWAAFADVLLNLAAVLVYHRRLSPEPLATAGAGAAIVKPSVDGDGGLRAFIWTRGGRDFSASELERLDRFKLATTAPADMLPAEGEWRGLYQYGGLFYAHIHGDWFHVSRTLEGVRIVDIRHPASLGPWLIRDTSGSWQLDRGPRLLGGAGELSLRSRKRLNTLKYQARQLLDSLPGRLDRSEKLLRIAHGPADVEDRLINDAQLFSDLSAKLQELAHGLDEYPKELVDKLDAGAKLLRAQGTRLRIERVKIDPPTIIGVSYLRSKQQIRIRSLGPRKDISGGKGRDFLKEYEISDLQRTPLWYAHFHYSSLDAADNNYTAAHLKTPRQRFQGINYQRAQEQSNQSVDAILRARIDATSASELFLSPTSW